MKPARIGAALAALALLTASAVVAAPVHYFSPDVPTDIQGSTVLPWEIARSDSENDVVPTALPPGTAVDSLYRLEDGDWLLSVEVPTELPAGSGVFFAPGDVVRWDGAEFTPYAQLSILPVDALFLDGGDDGDIVVSFEVPTIAFGSTFEPADLVRFTGITPSLVFDASEATPPVPLSTNVTAAFQRRGQTVMAFDVPTTLDGSTYLPGQLVAWDGESFSTFVDVGAARWPISSGLDALALPPPPGSIPPTLKMDKFDNSDALLLAWSRSCSVGAENYGIYEGKLGDWYTHTRLDCSDDGASLIERIAPSEGDSYYLVVPLNPNDEGEYGNATGGPRPVGTGTCVPTQALAACS